MKRTLYLFLLTMLLLTGCNDPKSVTEALNRAEALMNEHPDSAWAVLNTLSLDGMGQNRTRARYALLYTQAQDKTYRDETNDSLISIAVDYYRATDDVRRKFLSFYYRGRVMVNAGEFIKAMLSFLEAESLCEEVVDDYLLGLLYTQMGVVYKEYYDYHRSLEMFKKAAFSYERAGKDFHRLYALVDQAVVCKHMEKNEDSYHLLHSVLEEAKKKEYVGLIKLCLGDLIMQCVDMGKVIEADTLYQMLRQNFNMSSFSSSFMANIAEIHAMKKEWNLSELLLEQAWQRAKTEKDSIVLHLTEAHIYEMKYPQTKAYCSMLEGVKKQNRLVRKSMEQPILSVQANLLATELEYQQYKLRTERIQRWTIVILMFILSVIIIYEGQKWLRKLYRKRIREQLRKKEASHLLDLERLQKEMIAKDENIHSLIKDFNRRIDAKDTNFRRVLVKLENELASKNELYDEYVQQAETLKNDKERYVVRLKLLFSERIELIDDVIRIQNSDSGSDRAKINALIDTVEEFTKKIIKSRAFYKELEEYVNMSNQNVMMCLRMEVKLPDEDCYRQVCYHIAGYSVHSISILMGETKNKIYKRRDRIRKKIEDLNPKSVDLFIGYLYK